MASGQQVFDNTVYGSSGNSGGGGGGGAAIMGSPAQIAARLGYGRKKGRNKGRSSNRGKRK